MLLVSHDMGTLRDICDVGIVVDNGKMQYFDNINDAIDEYVAINK